jgi:predicted nucleic acid-binding protein
VIVLDASVLIAHLDATDSHHDRACELLLLAADQDEPLGASPITLAEVLVGPARANRLDQATAALDQLGVDAVVLPPDAPLRLATLRAGIALKMPDCCVLLAANQSGGAVATFDDRLADAAGSHGLAVWGRFEFTTRPRGSPESE